MVRAGLIIASGFAALVACYLAILAPALRTERPPTIYTPGLSGVTVRSQSPVPAGGKACTTPIYLTKESSRVQYLLAGPVTSTAGIGLTVVGSGLEGKATGASLQPAGTDTLLTLSFSPVAATDGLAARICLRPSKAPLSLVGTDESRSAVVAQTSVDGKKLTAQVAIVLLGKENRTTAEALSDVPARVSATTLGLMPTWLVWALVTIAALAAISLPIATLAWADRQTSEQ